jgi:hypothetical protein
MNYSYLIVLLLAFSCGVRAECQLVTSQQTVTYSPLSAMERQSAGGKTIRLPEKQLALNVICDKPQRVRLFFSSSLPRSNIFALGDSGEMKITAMTARVDDKEAMLASVSGANAVLTDSGHQQVDIALNGGIAFLNGDELTGQNISVTLAVNSEVKSASITDREKYRGNLQVKVEAQ